MRAVLKNAVALSAGSVGMLALDAWAERQPSVHHGSGSTWVRAFLDVVRPRAVTRATLEHAVRRKVARTVTDPNAIRIAIEHGCVDLRGAISTRERARLVRAVAMVPGVDSVVDLMTERAALPAERPTMLEPHRPGVPSAHITRRNDGRARMTHTAPVMVEPTVSRAVPAVARIAAIGIGLAVCVASIRIRSGLGVPIATLGLGLVVVGAGARWRPAIAARRASTTPDDARGDARSPAPPRARGDAGSAALLVP